MEKTLALYKIKTLGWFTNDGEPRNYAYTASMLSKDIFIEYYFEDTTEFDQDQVLEEVDSEDDQANVAYGNQLSVVMKYRSNYYQFLMYHDCLEIGVPIMQVQTIVFLVKLIEEVPADQLIEHLTGLSPDPLIPHTIPEKEFREAANDLLELKLHTIHKLIEEEKLGLN